MKLGTFRSSALVLAGSLLAATGLAQTVNPGGLNIPANAEILGNGDPSVRKATAIVNGHVITGTDIDHRLALIVLANDGRVPPEEMQRLRAQVVRNLIDEALQIQAAEAKEIKVDQKQIDRVFADSARQFKQTPEQFSQYLRTVGSSDTNLKRQIHAEIAWSRLQGREIEPFVNVAEEEVNAVIKRMNANKGQQKYKIGEIFVSATPESAPQAQANLMKIVEQVRQGASFVAYARQFSEASTAAVGGDLGWVSADQLPEPLAEAARVLPVGQISNPIPVPGGFSLLLVQDTRQELMPDPRDATLSLKQMSLAFPPGSTQEQGSELAQRLLRTAQGMGGCGRAEEAAATIGAEVVANDQMKIRDFPARLQEMLVNLGIGQTTAPFGVAGDRLSVLVLCGRNDPQEVTGPSYDQIYAQLNDQRVNLRARRLLRDLQRDAVVEYR